MNQLNLKEQIEKGDLSPYFLNIAEMKEALAFKGNMCTSAGFFNKIGRPLSSSATKLGCINIICSNCPFDSDNKKLLKSLLPQLNEFVLPERWCIKTTPENIDIVGDYYNKQTRSTSNCYSYYDNDTPYLLSHSNKFDESIIKGTTLKNFKSRGPKEGYTEITFDQFKKYVLKQTDNMKTNKKIIGYKVPFDINSYIKKDDIMVYCYEQGYHLKGYKLKGAEYYLYKQLVETWEPVYEEEQYKVGDWITIEDPTKLEDGCRGCPKGTFQVTNKIHSNGLYVYNAGFNIEINYNNIWRISNEGVRLATPEEIEKATNIIVDGYKAEYDEHTVRFGCKKITLADLRTFKSIMRIVAEHGETFFVGPDFIKYYNNPRRTLTIGQIDRIIKRLECNGNNI